MKVRKVSSEDAIVELEWEWPRDVMRRGNGIRVDSVWHVVDVREVLEDMLRTPRYEHSDGETMLRRMTGDGSGAAISEFVWTWPDGRHRHYRRFDDGQWRKRYLGRRVLYVRIPWLRGHTLRLHTFYRGDDDSAPHDHPWWFVTFPLTTYTETAEFVPLEGIGPMSPAWRVTQIVRRFRFHFRPATYRHFVHEPDRPFHTVVISGERERKWGFWPKPDEFVPYDQYAEYRG